MMGGIFLVLCGMGLVAAISMSGSDADPDVGDDEITAGPQDEDVGAENARVVTPLDALIPTEATEAGETFVAATPRGDSDDISEIWDFDTSADIVAFNLPELARDCENDAGASHFAPDSTLYYTLTISPGGTGGDTVVTLELFDATDPDTDPVHYDVLLRNVPKLDATCVSVLNGAEAEAEAFGGERASAVQGTDGDDLIDSADDTALIQTGVGNDHVAGTADGARISTGAGEDSVDLAATGSDIFLGDGKDTADLSGTGNHIDGGAGDDAIAVDLGTDVTGGDGADTIKLRVSEAPSDGLPLFLWDQPVGDDRFSAHSTVTLDDSYDDIHVALGPNVPGHLHEIHLTRESYGESSQEVYTHEYTLILWTPESVTDIADLVTGPNSVFNGSLAQDSAKGDAEYEAAANDPNAPRVILTIENGASFSGSFDELTGAVTGDFDDVREADLTTNREITSIHKVGIF